MSVKLKRHSGMKLDVSFNTVISNFQRFLSVWRLYWTIPASESEPIIYDRLVENLQDSLNCPSQKIEGPFSLPYKYSYGGEGKIMERLSFLSSQKSQWQKKRSFPLFKKYGGQEIYLLFLFDIYPRI